jgi:hypothetical protein
MSYRSMLVRASVLFALVIAAAMPARAAIITWGAAQTVSGDSDVSTAGTLVGALNLGEPRVVVSTTVNGVTFDGLGLNGPSVNFGNFEFTAPFGGFTSFNDSGQPAPYSGLSAPYKLLLNDGGSSVPNFTLKMIGLAAGENYQFQWWTGIEGLSGSRNTVATAGNSVTLKGDATGGLGGLGQFAIGSFIADASGTQTIDFKAAPGSTADALINGLQLRDLGPTIIVIPGGGGGNPVPLAPGVWFGALGAMMVAGKTKLRRSL